MTPAHDTIKAAQAAGPDYRCQPVDTDTQHTGAPRRESSDALAQADRRPLVAFLPAQCELHERVRLIVRGLRPALGWLQKRRAGSRRLTYCVSRMAQKKRGRQETDEASPRSHRRRGGIKAATHVRAYHCRARAASTWR